MKRSRFVHLPGLSDPPPPPDPELDPKVEASTDRFFGDYGPEGSEAEKRIFERFEEVFAGGLEFSAGIPFDSNGGEPYSWIDRVDLPAARLALRRAGDLLGQSFKLNLFLLDAASRREAEVRRESGRRGAKRRVANNPKSLAMAAIRAEWTERKRRGLKFTPKSFAYEMHRKFEGVVTVESIRNALGKWAKEFHPGT
jgi:hypothetical protein